MKKILVLATALTVIGGAAIAQTTSPTNPQQRPGAPGNVTQTPPSQAEVQRCQVLPTEAERTRCMNQLSTGAGGNPPAQRSNNPPPARTSPPAQTR